MRENQHIVFTRRDQQHTADIGMQTVLFVGSSSTVEYMDVIFTPRGDTKKYAVTSDSPATQIRMKNQEG
jgi:precorrin-3B C17-methyltransferase